MKHTLVTLLLLGIPFTVSYANSVDSFDRASGTWIGTWEDYGAHCTYNNAAVTIEKSGDVYLANVTMHNPSCFWCKKENSFFLINGKCIQPGIISFTIAEADFVGDAMQIISTVIHGEGHFTRFN